MCAGATRDQAWALGQAGLSLWWDNTESLGELEIISGVLERLKLRARDKAQLVQGGRRLHLIYNQSKNSFPFCPLRTDLLLPTSTKCSFW